MGRFKLRGQRVKPRYKGIAPDWCTWIAVYGVAGDPQCIANRERWSRVVAEAGAPFVLDPAIPSEARGEIHVLLLEIINTDAFIEHASFVWANPADVGTFPVVKITSNKTGQMCGALGCAQDEDIKELLAEAKRMNVASN